MTAAADHSSPNSRGTPDSSSADRNQQSGFTAVNGRSPSNSSGSGNSLSDLHLLNGDYTHSQQGHYDQDMNRRDSQNSLGKRKDSMSNEQSASTAQNHNSQKKQRVSPNVEQSKQNETIPERSAEDASWNSHQRNGSVNSDSQIAEVLQSNIANHQLNAVETNPDPRFQQASQQQQYAVMSGQMQTPPSGVTAPMLQKQRKRNFSNRTKTGCLTCRERKKKCDETKPKCNNCERGGFFCKGYSQNNNLYKASIPREQPPLQAKDHYYEPYNTFPGHMAPAPYYEQAPPPETRRPLPVDEEREQGRAIPNPEDPHLRNNFRRSHQWSDHPPHQFPPEQLARQEYSHPPHMPEMSRQHKTLPSVPQVLHPPHNGNIPHTAAPNSQPSQYTTGPPNQYNNQRAIAQHALEHSRTWRTEKEKMLDGIPFQTRDPQLQHERYECAQAVYRFNKNAVEPGNLSGTPRRDQFRTIIERSPSSQTGSPTNRNAQPNSDSPQNKQPPGHLGANVEVEAPFYCEYGYNIRVGDDVDIGPNCRIMDSCPVEIGARTIISPNVQILTLDGEHSIIRQPGEKRLLKAKRVVIGEDVFIGAGAIVMPGVTIHNGAVIGAGSVVHKSINGPVTWVNALKPRLLKSPWDERTLPRQYP